MSKGFSHHKFLRPQNNYGYPLEHFLGDRGSERTAWNQVVNMSSQENQNLRTVGWDGGH